jgi:putative effector of murein hydrolase LrgA (UPF0299 family)
VIGGLVRILLFQGLGELGSRFLLPLLPGPVLGLILLLAWFAARRRIPEPVDGVASVLVQNLGLLFVPAAVGVVMYWPQLVSHGVALLAALLASAVLTIAVPALILKGMARAEEPAEKAEEA